MFACLTITATAGRVKTFIESTIQIVDIGKKSNITMTKTLSKKEKDRLGNTHMFKSVS